MEQIKQMTALFRAIESRDDALKVVRDAAIVLCVITIAQAALDFVNNPVWLNTRLIAPLIFTVLALALWGFRSRTIALVFLGLFLIGIFVPILMLSAKLPHAMNDIWHSAGEILLGVLGFLVSVRAVAATSKLQREDARSEAIEPTAGDLLAEVHPSTPLGSIIQRSPILSWLAVLAPPLLFIPLFFTPFDIGPAALLWGAGFIAVPISIMHLAKFLDMRAAGKVPFRKETLRPLLTILIVVAAVVLVVKSRHSADEFGRSLANLAQAQCKTDGVCPTSLREFTCTELTYRKDRPCQFETLYGEYGARFWIRYIIPEDKKSFLVFVRHDIDSDLVFTGGVETEFTEKLNNH